MSDEYPWLKPIQVEMTFENVDPEVLGILTGGALGTPPTPTFSLEVTHQIKRKWWQWLLRRPKRYHRIVIPNARLATPEDEVTGDG